VLNKIHFLGQSSFRIDGPPVVYLDPYMLSGDQPPADVILITHEHRDHCSPEAVAKIQEEDTVIVTITAAAEKLQGDVRILGPGDRVTVKGIDVEAVPAYNVDKFRSPGVPYHPKASGHVGLIVTMEGQRLYHAGDTDHIPEMADLGEIDVAFLPISGGPVMTADEAVEAVATIHPKAAIPMHIGRHRGTEEDIATFQQHALAEVVLLAIE
jgi:L-ascorbate metabolism protein UlaG (beta-lactamase superfamily)